MNFRKLHPEARLPAFATDGSAGMDLSACEAVTVPVRGRKLVRTGLALELPSAWHEAQIRSRSGMALKYGIVVLNSPGTIDSDYSGEIGVILINHGEADFEVKVGDRIAQIVFAEVVRPRLVQWTDTVRDSARGTGGFGSTGIDSPSGS